MSKPSAKPPPRPVTVEASESLKVNAPFRAYHVGQPAPGELTGDLVVSGWIVAEGKPVERVVVTADGRALARVRADRPRPDIAEAFPDLETAGQSGFRILLPPGVLREAREILVEAAVGEEPLQPLWRIGLGYGRDAAAEAAPSRSKGKRRWRRRREPETAPRSDAPTTDDFRVVAIISTFNEADIIGPVLAHLAENGIASYLIDNESTDDTVELAGEWFGRGLLGIESIPTATDDRTSWKSILARKLELAGELGADWYIHHDADEIREGPWPGMSLREAIRHVDRLGYNAIDFRVLNFRPVDDAFRPGDDPREHFSRWEGPADYDRAQRKCWKAGFAGVALEDGGHDVRFPDRRLFPLRFLLRHYPIRSQAHGTRKVMRERKDRFVTEESEMGWHRQYADVSGMDHQFLKNPGSLRPFDLPRLQLETTIEDGRATASEAAVVSTTSQAPGIIGRLDQVGSETISGWAARVEGGGDPLTVEVWDGDRIVATAVANAYRADLEKEGIADGQAAFTIQTPRELLDGRSHWIWANVQDTGVALRPSPVVLRSDARPAAVASESESVAIA